MAKLQSMKKEYERLGFHLQRLYKRRKRDDEGIMRSTFGDIMKPYDGTYNSSSSGNSSSGVNRNTKEQIENLKKYSDAQDTSIRSDLNNIGWNPIVEDGN